MQLTLDPIAIGPWTNRERPNNDAFPTHIAQLPSQNLGYSRLVCEANMRLPRRDPAW